MQLGANLFEGEASSITGSAVEAPAMANDDADLCQGIQRAPSVGLAAGEEARLEVSLISLQSPICRFSLQGRT